MPPPPPTWLLGALVPPDPGIADMGGTGELMAEAGALLDEFKTEPKLLSDELSELLDLPQSLRSKPSRMRRST